MPPIPKFVVQISDSYFLETIIAGASAIEATAQVALHAQSEDEFRHLKIRGIQLK